MKENDAATAARLRAALREVLAAQGDALWRSWTQGAPADLAAAWAGHEELLAPASVAAVRRAGQAASGPGAHELRRLAAFLAAEQVAAGTRDLAERAAQAQEDAVFAVDGQERSLLDLEAVLAAEPDRERRAAIYRASFVALARVASARAELHAREEQLARSLGWEGTLALAEQLRAVEADGLRALSAGLLEATAAAAYEALDGAARDTLGYPLEEMSRADVPRLFAAPAFRPRFPRGGALPALERTVQALGLPLRGAPGLTLLDGPSPHKDPRAACFPVRVPGDVRLSLLPQTADWPALLRESGTAVRLLLASEEVLGPGGGAAGEAFAALFERLAEDDGWLRANTALTDPEIAAVRSAARTRRLYALRRAAARALAELERRDAAAAGNPAPGSATYQREMARAHGFALPAEAVADLAELDRDPFLASADQLRGGVLAGMLERRLRAAHGPRWWSTPEAGAQLRAWFARPYAGAAELARAAGSDALDPAALVAP